jgi:hypothetical protein
MMSNPIIRIHDLATGEVVDRPMTAAEMKKAEAEKACLWLVKKNAKPRQPLRQHFLNGLALQPTKRPYYWHEPNQLQRLACQ